MLVDPQSNAAVAYTATDSAGGFTLQVKDGVYQIGAVRPGYVSVLSAPVPLQSGERLTIRVPIAQNRRSRAPHWGDRARPARLGEHCAGA